MVGYVRAQTHTSPYSGTPNAHFPAIGRRQKRNDDARTETTTGRGQASPPRRHVSCGTTYLPQFFRPSSDHSGSSSGSEPASLPKSSFRQL